MKLDSLEAGIKTALNRIKDHAYFLPPTKKADVLIAYDIVANELRLWIEHKKGHPELGDFFAGHDKNLDPACHYCSE